MLPDRPRGQQGFATGRRAEAEEKARPSSLSLAMRELRGLVRRVPPIEAGPESRFIPPPADGGAEEGAKGRASARTAKIAECDATQHGQMHCDFSLSRADPGARGRPLQPPMRPVGREVNTSVGMRPEASRPGKQATPRDGLLAGPHNLKAHRPSHHLRVAPKAEAGRDFA